MKKKFEKAWLYDERKHRQTFIKDFASPAYVKAVEESSSKNTSKNASTAKRKTKNGRKKKKPLSKS